MRISSDKNDVAYPTYEALGAKRFRTAIMLDGVEVTDCVTADEEAGTVMRYRRNPETGHLLIEDGKVVEEVMTGKVVIVLPV